MKPLTNSEKDIRTQESRAPDNARSSFLSHISHDIRTPLNSIMGFSKLLINRPTIDSRNKEYAQRIVYSSNVLLNYVENLIDLSQYETNNYKLIMQPVNLNNFSWKIVEYFLSKRNEQNLSELDLVVVWKPESKDITITTDYEILKKAVCRLLNMVANIYFKGDLELEYRYVGKKQVRISINPTESTSLIKTDSELSYENDFNTLNTFNYEVLESSVCLLGGNVTIDTIQNEYYIDFPLNHDIEYEKNDIKY